MKHVDMAIVLVLGLSALSYAQNAHTANPETGKTGMPKITAEDLAACKKEIAEFHRREIDYLKKEALDYCTKDKNSHYNAENCRNANEWVNESSTTSNLTWFMKGNDRCDASAYPCFGISIFNDGEGLGEETLRDMARHPLPSTAKDGAGKPWDYSGFDGYYLVVHGCIARVWLAKLNLMKPADSAAKKSGKPSAADSAQSSTVGKQIQNNLGSDKLPPPASDPKPIGHVEQNCPSLPKGYSCGGVEGGNDRDKIAEKQRELQQDAKKKAKQHAEDMHRFKEAQTELKKQRDAENALQRQAFADSQKRQEAAVAKQTAQNRAEIQAQINRKDAVTFAVEDSCPPYAVFNNHTNVALWVTWEYTLLNGESIFPWRADFPIAANGRERLEITGHECTNKPWKLQPGSVVRWKDT